MALGQSQEAIETYQLALVLQPKLVDAHSNLGNLYKSQVRVPRQSSSCCKSLHRWHIHRNRHDITPSQFQGSMAAMAARRSALIP